MFNLKNFLLSSSLLFSVFSSPVFSNPKVLKVGAIPDQNQDVLDKRFNLFSKELSKQLETVMLLATELRDENKIMSVELNSDAPFIEPHFEQEQPNILEQLKTFSNSAERSKFVLDNLQEIWGKRGVVDNRT